MTDGYDRDLTSFVVDLIADPPIANTNTPQILFVLYFQTSGRTGILGKTVYRFCDPGQDLTIKPARFTSRSQA
jgi:hypothetical protein